MKSPFPSRSQDRPLKNLPSRSHALSSMAFLTRVTFVTWVSKLWNRTVWQDEKRSAWNAQGPKWKYSKYESFTILPRRSVYVFFRFFSLPVLGNSAKPYHLDEFSTLCWSTKPQPCSQHRHQNPPNTTAKSFHPMKRMRIFHEPPYPYKTPNYLIFVIRVS